jgi:hypothetical protein
LSIWAEAVEKVGLGADLFAVTIPCCANQRCRRYADDDGSAATDGIVILLPSLGRPEDHLLRLIDGYVDLGFVRERLKDFYSSTGRPSIDPEVLLRLLLVGYLYGITSERGLLEEVRMHLAYRWFTRLGFEQVPSNLGEPDSSKSETYKSSQLTCMSADGGQKMTRWNSSMDI